ncbi:acyloxyacyl hydrolase [Spirosoma fluviale]|uniref:Lipid A 3-O-deacylase (PagL) n=1 Tax=Spirosoma fluviale TaxID=1597977 RepID=A0A286GX19_9BACT|nr:acyloxyacyl hydrolase [Spirosoma fluviale]SOD99604.1 Lipid A 3-O-deacylase (PagL) [Spirosoma fluviale]
MNLLILLSGLWPVIQPPIGDSVRQQIGVQAYTGFIIPHAPDLKAISQTRPVGAELTYSRTTFNRAAYERCNCFARTGAYVNYVAFNNPAELGRTVGLGGYFEPLIRHRKPLYFSLRATAGLAYITRVYDAESNPGNTFFGSPLSGMLALSVNAHHRLTQHIHASLTASYNHISNGGIRQPNRGMNFPTLGLGLVYITNPAPLPNPAYWPKPTVNNRFTKRVMAFGSVRTLPQTDILPETVGWLWGFSATAGYRISRFHAFTGGLEFVDDGYIREQLRRENKLTNHRQLGLLGGYELWLGRYTFTTHLGWNLVQPAALPDGRLFQRYQLLYTVRNHYLVGVGLRARLNVAEGFDLRMGVRF